MICCAPWDGSLFAMLQPSGGYLGRTLGLLGITFGAIWDHGRAILVLIGMSWGVLGSTLEENVEGLGFGVWRLGLDRHNACFLEMPKSLLTYACAAKTFA